QLHRAMQGEEVTYEYHIFDHDHRRRVQGSYMPDRDAEGRVLGVVVLVTQISKRDDLQLEIARSEAMFAEAFENAPAGKTIVDTEGRIVRANAKFAAMVGRPAVELIGVSIVELTHPDDIELDLRQLRETLLGKRVGYN
ncbi:PAS domain-containing protein, partial [Escherichia coli]|uniref:PAS domain-containing protein n=1 Tax=Escherichia coli TaxID=562 RepID=UPI00136569B1